VHTFGVLFADIYLRNQQESLTMSIASVGITDTQQPNVQNKSNTYNQDIWASVIAATTSGQAANTIDATKAPAKNASSTENQVNSAASTAALTSTAVNNTLMRLQETGSVFSEKDAETMDYRGVTEDERNRYAEIIQDAASKDAYSDPLSYINSLSPEDVTVVQHVHCLAKPSGVTDTKTEEGAINLLLPPSQQVDLDNNGLISEGTANMFKFPPTNAPQSVKDAWDETTKDMTLSERLMTESAFMVVAISANVQCDDSGRATGICDPSDPDYKNPFGSTEAEWMDTLDSMVSQYKGSVQQHPELQDKLDFLTAFQDNIKAHADGEQPDVTETEKVVENINGKDVIISGHSADNNGNISFMQTIPSYMLNISDEVQAQIDDPTRDTGFEVVSSTPLTALPAGVTSRYTSISYFETGGSSPILDTQSLDGSFDRGRVADYLKLYNTEQQLKAKYGDNIKLAYSYNDDAYIMLTPDDMAYDKIQPASQGMSSLAQKVYRGDIPKSEINDLLQKYNISL